MDTAAADAALVRRDTGVGAAIDGPTRWCIRMATAGTRGGPVGDTSKPRPVWSVCLFGRVPLVGHTGGRLGAAWENAHKKLVPKAGLEPARGVATRDFESRASANSATSATTMIIAAVRTGGNTPRARRADRTLVAGPRLSHLRG